MCFKVKVKYKVAIKLQEQNSITGALIFHSLVSIVRDTRGEVEDFLATTRNSCTHFHASILTSLGCALSGQLVSRENFIK